MATMNISLPDEMKEWVEAQARSGRYANASDVVRDLIRKEQDRYYTSPEFLALIDEGLESGISEKSVDDIWKDVTARIASEDDAA